MPPDRPAAEEILALAIARRNRRAGRRPTIITWYTRPVVTVCWPGYVTTIYLN